MGDSAPHDGPSHPASGGPVAGAAAVDPVPAIVAAPVSPVQRMSWLLLATSLCACAASILGVLVAPGMAGNATGDVVDAVQHLSDVFAYATTALLMVLVFVGAYEIARAPRLGVAPRIVVVGAAGLVVALAAPAMRDKLHPLAAIFLATAASVSAVAAGWQAARVPHTRAVGVVLIAMALAAVVRIGAWELAAVAGERSSTRMYDLASGVASAGVVLEGLGQLVAAAWLGTRGRLGGRILSNVAIAAAFIVTWGAARGVHPGASTWEAVLHSALADAAGTPPPAGLAAVATFLACCAIFLALVALAQRGQVTAVLAALSLALLARGTLDVPLRALAIAAAAHWILLAIADDRSMWRALIAQREARPAAPAAAPAVAAPATPPREVDAPVLDDGTSPASLERGQD